MYVRTYMYIHVPWTVRMLQKAASRANPRDFIFHTVQFPVFCCKKYLKKWNVHMYTKHTHTCMCMCYIDMYSTYVYLCMHVNNHIKLIDLCMHINNYIGFACTLTATSILHVHKQLHWFCMYTNSYIDFACTLTATLILHVRTMYTNSYSTLILHNYVIWFYMHIKTATCMYVH